jgi:tetratricopeptide (TPR) repeat protein
VLRGVELALVRQGRLVLAEARLTEALSLARQTSTRFIEGRVLLEFGELAIRQRQPERAVSWLRGAVELWQSLKLPVWHARSLYRLGCALHDAGDAPAAEAAWLAALELFRELGTAEAEQVVERLAAASLTP